MFKALGFEIMDNCFTNALHLHTSTKDPLSEHNISEMHAGSVDVWAIAYPGR